MISATTLLMKTRHNPRNKLLRGFLLNSRFAILKPSLSNARSMIRVIVPAFRYGTRLSSNLTASSTIIVISTDDRCADSYAITFPQDARAEIRRFPWFENSVHT